MFAYALIAAELLLLSLVFWFVFVREPKPYKVKENLWGYYGPSTSESITNDSVSFLPPFATSIQNDFSYSKSKKQSRRRRINHQIKRVVRSTRHGVKNGFSRGNAQDLRNGWNYVCETKPSNVGNLLAYMGQLLTNLSAKFS